MSYNQCSAGTDASSGYNVMASNGTCSQPVHYTTLKIMAVSTAGGAATVNWNDGFSYLNVKIPQVTEFRVQYAWLEPDLPDFEGRRRLWTGQFAPIDEFAEVENPQFRQYLERLVNDPDYRERQLKAQMELFAQQNEVPMWTTRALEVFHKFREGRYVDLPIAELKHIIKVIDEDSMRYIQPDGEGKIRILNVQMSLVEWQLFKELLTNEDVRIEELYRDYRNRLLAHEHYIHQLEQAMANGPFTGIKMPHLSKEQQDAADLAAMKLLQTVLSPEEAEGLIKDGHVKIPSPSDPECIYLVKRVPSERVEVYRKGVLVDKLCLYFTEGMHKDDVVLSKIMMLKHSEKDFLEVANHFPVISKIDGFRLQEAEVIPVAS